MLYTEVCTILISRKFPVTALQVLLEVCAWSNSGVIRNQPPTYPQNIQQQDQHFMKQGHLEEICWQDTALCSKCGAANCMNVHAANKD